MSETPVSPPLTTVTAPVRPRRRRWVTILLSLLLLLSGMVIGSGATLIIAHRVIQYRMRHPEQLPGRAVARMRRPLSLSDDQVVQVRTILRQHMVKLQAMRRQWQPLLETELDGIEKDVAAVLKPDQAEKWHRIAREKRHQWLPPLPPAGTQPSQD